jgi:hypothetical protein
MSQHGGRLLVALTACTLLLVAWVTAASDSVSFVTGRPRTADTSESPLEEQEEATDPVVPPGMQSQEVPGWLEIAIQVIAVTMASILLGFLLYVLWMVWANRRRRRVARRRPGPVPDHAVHDAFLDEAHRELTEATTDQLTALRAGAPRNAIVACWVALEAAVERAGVVRDAAETSSELTARVVDSLGVDGATVAALADLYREARFSVHQLDEGHRARAIELLRQISADLAQRQSAVPAGGNR